MSVKYLDCFNKNINEKKWKDKLFFYDNLLIEYILENRLKSYGYNLENKISKYYLVPVLFLVFLPMKYELKAFGHTFRNSISVKAKAASVKNWGKFYILRILLYLKFIWKRVSKKTFLPNFFIQEKYC